MIVNQAGLTKRKGTALIGASLVLCVAILGICRAPAAQAFPGRDAGTLKYLIGKTLDPNGRPSALRSWTYVGGTGVSDEADENQLTIVHYRKGLANAVLFHSRPANQTRAATILDVIDLKSVATDQILIVGECRYHKEDSSAYIAIAKKSSSAYLTNIKRAWYVDRDKLKFSRLSTTLGIDCRNDNS